VGYAGVSGGQEAILAAEDLVRRARYGGSSAWLELDQIIERLPLAIDRVMGEGGLWARELAARAIRQSEGDLLEAAQLLRAHRSTLPRLGYSVPVTTDDLRETRRIGSVFREPPGGQVLGNSPDYLTQLLDLTPEHEARAAEREGTTVRHAAAGERMACEPAAAGASLAALLADGLVEERPDRSVEGPYDITRVAAQPGAPRSARLSTLARAETSSMAHLWYTTTSKPQLQASEFPVELRRGRMPLRWVHPYTGQPVTVAEVEVTEVQTVRGAGVPGDDATRFSTGYGLCFGDNESKALAMAGLDLLVHRDPDTGGLEQQVLMHLDGPDSSGFLEHLKLPHYVDFRSTLERVQAIRTVAVAGGAA